MIEIVTKVKSWDASYMTALIKNYGPPESNAFMIFTQPFHLCQDVIGQSPIHASGYKHPFWISGLDDKSLRNHCSWLLNLIRSKTVSNLSFTICRQSNRGFDRGPLFDRSTLEDFKKKLVAAFTPEDESVLSSPCRENTSLRYCVLWQPNIHVCRPGYRSHGRSTRSTPSIDKLNLKLICSFSTPIRIQSGGTSQGR